MISLMVRVTLGLHSGMVRGEMLVTPWVLSRVQLVMVAIMQRRCGLDRQREVRLVEGGLVVVGLVVVVGLLRVAQQGYTRGSPTSLGKLKGKRSRGQEVKHKV